jgi:protein SSD1
MLIHDLTERYGPVVREGRVTGVLDAAFDIFIVSFRIWSGMKLTYSPNSGSRSESMPTRCLLAIPSLTSTKMFYRMSLSSTWLMNSLYWTKRDTISYLADGSDDPHTLRIKSLYDRRATGNLTTQTTDTDALFSSSSTSADSSKQYAKSANGNEVPFEGLRKAGQHQVQDIKELMSVPVIITSDMSKSPPVLVVYACKYFLLFVGLG